MNYKIVNGAISYGAGTILEEINFDIHDKDKIAIVGNNGAGKSSLLKALVDNEMLEAGIGELKFEVHKQGNPEIGYLKQVEFENSDSTFLEEILKSYKYIVELENKINRIQNQLQIESTDKLIKEYTRTLEEYERNDGYTYKKEYEVAIKKFGFSEQDKYKKISEFSGGQKTKIAFLKLLLSKPDILLLDEPTNHLDITTIEWLESYLKNYPKSIVIVSHDRMFLDKIVNKVYEIEYASITEYKGNYSAFEIQKRENYEKQLKDYEYQQKEIKRLKAVADRFKFKPTKAKMALSKLRKIEQMTIIEEPNKYDLRTFHTNFNIPVQSGNKVLSVKELQIGYNENHIAKVSFDLYKGQKLAIIGENGKGKSTLLKTIMGFIPEISGNFEYGYHVVKEYFDQQMEILTADGANTVFDHFSSEFPKLTTTQIRQSLGAFLFSGEEVFKEINVLSGGEKVRLQLCEIFKKEANLLLLDEPTNHMDILGKESLENILKEYKGTLIFISHDRYFVNKIADSILAFEPQGVVYFNGNYEEYLKHKEENTNNYVNCSSVKNATSRGSINVNSKSINSNTNINSIRSNTINSNANRELDQNSKKKNATNEYFLSKERARKKNKINKLELEIEQKENEVKDLKSQMQSEDIASDYKKLEELQNEIIRIEQEIENKMTEWEELSNSL